METTSKILIVDDDEIIRETLGHLLSKGGYQILFGENGEEGLQLAVEHQPDVILMDVMMPGMNGYETCRSIRAIPALAEVPILMITALEDRSSLMTGIQAGADDFLSKNIDGLELLARVQTITRLNRYRRIMEQQDKIEKAHQELVISYEKTIEGWVNAIDIRDQETEGNSARLIELTLKFAQKAGIPQGQMEHIRRGTLLHDVGNMGIPDQILLKHGKLTEEEWAVVRKHPVNAHEWLSAIEYLGPALDIPYCHHEKWDGSGYPRGLRGEEIPLEARLFAIVDVWVALISRRPFRAAWSRSEALNYIKQNSGTHFDPALVEIFLSLMNIEKDA
jgi:putative two-component system response regulator